MKKCLLLACALLFVPLSLSAQVTIGSIEIRNDVELPSDSAGGHRGAGQRGTIVEVHDLVIEGYEGRFLTIALQAVKESTQFLPYDYTMMLADSDLFRLDRLTFEITNGDLHRYLGPGTHDIYFVFSVNAQLESETEPLPGGIHYRAATVVMPAESPVDVFMVERERADAVLRSLARGNPFYDEVLAFAEKYNLIISIRDFALGNNATTLYEWEFCTDEDSAALERNLASMIRNWEIPVDFIERTGLRALVFVRNASFMGTGVGGGADLAGRFVLCQIDPDASDERIMHVLYHEYMHYIDNVMYETKIFDADRWMALNPPGVGYSYSGAMEMIQHNYDFLIQPHPEPGFLNGYCMADIYQDKAEVFSCLLIPSWYERVEPWLQSDPYLAAKFEFMKQALATMSPQMTEYSP